MGTLANSVDPDEMQHTAAFHQGLHCLQRSKESSGTEIHHKLEFFYLPVRKGPAGIQVNLNTWNLKKNTGGFFSPSHEMEYRWKALYSNKMRRNMQIFPPGIYFQVEILSKNLNGFTAKFHLKFT